MNSKEINFTLDIKNLHDIPFDKYNRDFMFIVDGKKYPTSRFVADILSPKIRKMHFSDESINEFFIKTNKNNDHFGDFLNLSLFEENKLDFSLRKEYSNYFKQLGNINEYFKIEFDNLNTTTGNVIEKINQLLRIKTENYEFQGENFKRIVSFIASHFFEFKEEEILNLNREILEEIISSDSLIILDEDSLFNIVIKLYENDYSYSNLFSKIIFRNLSNESIEKFINTFSIDNIDSEIWYSICSRLLNSSVIENEKRYASFLKEKEFKIETNHEFEGIMNYLTKKTGGNIHDNGTVEITTNSIYENNKSGSYHPKNLTDYNVTNYYYSNNQSDVFVCFDFKKNKIQLSNYSIQSSINGTNSGHLRNWTIEVSNNGLDWEEIDRHDNDSALNNRSAIATYSINKKYSNFYRFIKLHQTGFSWRNDYIIYFPKIEFFGKLKYK